MEAFAAVVRNGAFVVDVREPDEYESSHVPRAALIPVGAIPNRLRELPRWEPVYVICAAGNRSRTVAGALAGHSLDPRPIAGGTQAWIGAGYPVVSGLHADRS